MHQRDPAVPKIVQRSRDVVARRDGLTLGVMGLWALVGVSTFAAMSVVGSGPAFDPNPLYTLIGVAGLFAAVLGTGWLYPRFPSIEAVKDARAVLTRWEGQREEWAQRVLAAEMSGLDADVKAHARAEASFEHMHRSRQQEAAQAKQL